MLFSDLSLQEHGHSNTSTEEREAQHHPAPITFLAASVLPACLEEKGHDKSLFTTRTKTMSRKLDQVLVTIASYREA